MDITIIGAGASGVMCAIEASKNKNNNITIIESNQKILKKLLITGNGKCNFTNLNFNQNISKEDFKKYYNNDFYYDGFKQFSNIDLIDYYKNLGLATCVFEKYDNKYVYPLTKNSRTLYYLLLDSLQKDNIKIILEDKFLSFKKIDNKFHIKTNKNNYISDVLVISTGGKAYYDNDNIDYVYKSLIDNNISINTIYPSLCPLKIDNTLFGKNSKFRFDSNITLYINDEKINSEYGEIQISNDLISGLPILNISSKAISSLIKKSKTYISINFLYSIFNTKYQSNNKNKDIDTCMMIKELSDFFYKHKLYNKNITIKQLLSYMLDTQIVNSILTISKTNDLTLSNITEESINKIINLLIDFKIDILGYTDFKSAQVTQGGVDTSEINSMTYESNKIENLYFTGELIDVNGICGGYNLQFAFGSGYIVGKQLNDKN